MEALRRWGGLARCVAFASLAAISGTTAGAAASTDAGGQGVAPTVPPFPEQCAVAQIGQPCAAVAGEPGTCVAASCEYTPDGGDSHSCQECAVCLGENPQFPRCTDTIACAPGNTCFVYGAPELFTGVGSPVSPQGWFRVYTLVASCLEGGAGPLTAPAWSPCGAAPAQTVGSTPDAGAWDGAYDDASLPLTVPGDPGASGSGSGSGAGFGAGSGPAADPAAPVGAADAAAGPPSVELLRSDAGCSMAGPAATSLPWLGLLPLWIARRRRRGAR